jgi:hypothetical protein
VFAREFLSNLKVEWSNCLLFFYKYARSETALEDALRLLRVRFTLTGKMGVRTKY